MKCKFALSWFLSGLIATIKYFIRPYLSSDTIKNGKILCHAFKLKYVISNCKCVLNNVYEFRYIKNGKIDWDNSIVIMKSQ